MKNSIFRGVLAVMVTIILSAPAYAGLECLKTSYGKASTISGKFTQLLRHKDSGSVEKRTGEFFIQRPELVRWVTQKPFEELLIVNNDAVWNYLVDEEVVYKYRRELANENQNSLRFLLGDKDVETDFYIEDGEQKGNYLLFPKEPTANLTEAEIWLDEANCIIKKIKITDFYGNVNELEFADVTFDKKLDASLFKFTPPAGVDLEDNTKK